MIGDDLDNLIARITSDYENRIKETKKKEVMQKCTKCRWAKVCNPRKNVRGFEMNGENSIKFPKEEHTSLVVAFEVRFHCDKFKARKKPIAFEETRIWKLLKGGK